MSFEQRIHHVIADWASAKEIPLGSAPIVTLCKDPKFGHYQSNLALVAAKQLKMNPRQLGTELGEHLKTIDWLDNISVAGPGFVNMCISRPTIEESSLAQMKSERLAVLATEKPRTIAIDFSSPNVAKSMHVGHIRSTILGDTLSRILRFLGHDVITDNHIGDWGTQFGKILLGYKRAGQPTLEDGQAIQQIEKIYKEINELCKTDEATLSAAREELKKLQEGDEENLKLWELFREKSQVEFDSIYDRLNIPFDHTLGESFFNPWLEEVVNELKSKGIARESDGAMVVFFEGVKGLEDHPFLVQKSDGAALYSTTDLATIRYRVNEWKPDTILYVTDGRQQLHFKQLFNTAERWGYELEYQHVWFGSILGEDKTPLKTRDGNPIKLKELLNEAEERAAKIVQEKREDFDPEQLKEVARVIGLGAIKYADLAQNRNLDYVFDWDKLLAFEGNTAPYLINAYVRSRSILRKASFDDETVPAELHLEEELERDLARKCLQLEEILQQVSREYRPHYLCLYLYDLASLFHRFFEHCPVLKAKTDELKMSRLHLSNLTGRILKKGLNLLGIETLEEM